MALKWQQYDHRRCNLCLYGYRFHQDDKVRFVEDRWSDYLVDYCCIVYLLVGDVLGRR